MKGYLQGIAIGALSFGIGLAVLSVLIPPEPEHPSVAATRGAAPVQEREAQTTTVAAIAPEFGRGSLILIADRLDGMIHQARETTMNRAPAVLPVSPPPLVDPDEPPPLGPPGVANRPPPSRPLVADPDPELGRSIAALLEEALSEPASPSGDEPSAAATGEALAAPEDETRGAADEPADAADTSEESATEIAGVAAEESPHASSGGGALATPEAGITDAMTDPAMPEAVEDGVATASDALEPETVAVMAEVAVEPADAGDATTEGVVADPTPDLPRMQAEVAETTAADPAAPALAAVEPATLTPEPAPAEAAPDGLPDTEPVLGQVDVAEIASLSSVGITEGVSTPPETDAVSEAAPVMPGGGNVAAVATADRLPGEGASPSEDTMIAAVPPVGSAAPAQPRSPAPRAAGMATPLPAVIGPGRTLEGIRTGRLPQIGAEPVGEETDAPVVEAPVAEAATGDDARPRWQRFAAPVEADPRPVIGLILLDPAEDSAAQSAILGLPVPVTVALPPFAPDAPRRAALYAAAGHEIVLVLDEVPGLARPGDLEVMFQAWIEDYPDLMGVIDTHATDARRARALAPNLIPILSDLGLGLIAPERGLSPLLNAARGGGVAQAGLYRTLDPPGNDSTALARMLDRVAFEAERQGRVAVLARADDPTIRAAIVAWLSAEVPAGRAARVQTLPAGAVLDGN